MNFKAYDILSSLIPGFVLLTVLLNFEYDKDLLVPYTAIAFVLGFLINTIGSWLEDFYFFTWGGKPSSKLLDGKLPWKIKLYNHSIIKQSLQNKTTNATPSTDELFAIAMRIAFAQKDSRLEDFSASYAFSRTLVTCILICSIILIMKYYYVWETFLIVIPLIIFWYRCKQRGYYFAKEILNIYAVKENL